MNVMEVDLVIGVGGNGFWCMKWKKLSLEEKRSLGRMFVDKR